MSDLVWILWVVLGVILIVAEIFTSGFVLLWFGAGAIAAALAALAGAGYPFQFLIFFIVSIALTAASRTIFTKYLVRDSHAGSYKSGAESLPGQVGTVVSSSQGALSEGAVKVYGSTWTAYPAEGEAPLEAGSRVVVESVRGASIYVRRAPSAPDWRPSALPEGRED
ncbi:MAG TPA: NfeD family protein [Pyrinomonadaceae bacterium]|jgi:membrane protein implicated in regulation of membrane protease activity|nr:NfeD family protein [Pyrinomonadaceae bacterium]